MARNTETVLVGAVTGVAALNIGGRLLRLYLIRIKAKTI